MLHYFGGANFSKDRASFLPLPNVVNGDRNQHHTLKPQPKVCKTSAETRWKGARGKNKKQNLGNIFRGRSPEKARKKGRTKQTPPWKCFL